MKSVLHFFWSGTIGGAPRAVYQLIKHQLADGSYEPSVIFANPEGYYYDLIKELGVRVIEIKLKNDKQLRKTRKIVEIIKDFDIHHFHSPELVFMFSSLFCKNSKRIFTQRAGCVDYKGKQKIRYKIARYMIQNYFDAVSGNSRHACSGLINKWGLDKDKIFLTYNGIEFNLLDPVVDKDVMLKQLGISNKTVIATSADLRRWKRIELLIEACAGIKNQDFVLLIIGKGPDTERLKNHAISNNLIKKTIFAGEVKHIGNYLNAVDIFVQPSNEHESFGNSTVEAMYHGKPCIVFEDGGGLTEHVENDVNGYIVKNSKELTIRLEELIDDKNKRISFGNNGHNKVVESYSVEKMIESYNKVYKFIYGKP